MGQASGDIYLDSNATTRVIPAAAQEAHNAMEEMFGNPSSSHITGLRARFTLESTRKLVRSVLGAGDGQIIFTSGATEAIQTAVFSALCRIKENRAAQPADSQPRYLLYGATEHKAVPQALDHWNEMLGIGDQVISIPVDEQGMLDLEYIREHAKRADMICTMAVNNETGVITDLAQVEAVIREENPDVAWLVDSVQAIGKIDLQVDATTIDYAPLSGHKIHAPKGIGMLYVREGAPLYPLFAGGGQEKGARSGTENLPGAAAVGAVFRALQSNDPSVFRTHQQLVAFRDRLKHSLEKAFESIVFNTPFDRAVPTTINFSVQGFNSKEILDLFDAAGIRVSSGSACGSAIQGSYVLEAMGLPRWRSEGAIRLSFSTTNTEREIREACQRIEEAGKALCDSCLVISNTVGASATRPVDGLIQLKKGSLCSWVLIDRATRNCVIIDPIEDLADRIETLVRCQDCTVLAVLDTNMHLDHQSCRTMLVELLGEYASDSARNSDPLGWPLKSHGKAQLDDGSSAPYVRISSERVLTKISLPGHTVDGQAYLVGKLTDHDSLPADHIGFAFTGETIQIGGLGRTDLDTSSPEKFYESLQRLKKLIGPATVLCPTHDYQNGYCTSLGSERATNELLRKVLADNDGISLADFLAEKSLIDSRINDDASGEFVCGLIQSKPDQHLIDIPCEELPEFFAQHDSALIVDVREPYEHRLTRDWDALGLQVAPENVPLTRFTNFVQRLLADPDARDNQQIICLCRSGSRSGKAAEVLRRAGVQNAFHMAGGLALGARHDSSQHEMEDMEYII